MLSEKKVYEIADSDECNPNVGWGPKFSYIRFARAIESAANAPLLAQLEPFAPYLKEGETPIQRLEREHKDNAALLGLLAKDRERIAELTRELEEARKDAERYRRIIAVCESDGFGYWLPEICLKEGSLPPSKQESDAAIDAAIKEQT